MRTMSGRSLRCASRKVSSSGAIIVAVPATEVRFRNFLEIFQQFAGSALRRLTITYHRFELASISFASGFIVCEMMLQIDGGYITYQPFPRSAAVLPDCTLALEQRQDNAGLAFGDAGRFSDVVQRDTFLELDVIDDA